MTTVNKRLQQLVEILLMTFLSGMVLLTFTDVIGRRLFNTPVFGAHDITEHLMAVIVFSGLPLLTANRAHLSIDLFDRWLLQPQWRIWHYLVNGLIAAVLALIAYEFAVSVQEANDMREVSQALGIPRAWMYAYLAITSGLAALAALTAGLPTHHEGNEA
ncbi:MAG: TRAP transporter small permease [Burkholderiaceae bacterium]|jgi:TRAP-type C4-dicarboxylate transport system permease small subunit